VNLSTDKMSMAMTSSNDQITGERIDRLMTVEIRPLNGGLPAGYVVPMYNVCRCTTCADVQRVPLSPRCAAQFARGTKTRRHLVSR
jgi:hypothetical protein